MNSGVHLRRIVSKLDVDRLSKLLTEEKQRGKTQVSNGVPIFIFLSQLETQLRKIAIRRGIKTDKDTELEQCLEDSSQENNENEDANNNLQRIFVEKVFEKMIKLLVEYGYDVNEKDIHERTALHHSIKNGLNDTAKFLIDSGAEIDAEARVSSWISMKLPALYHSLYVLDLEVTKTVLQESTMIPVLQIADLNAFIFIPCDVPEEIQQCLMGSQEINPLTFLLFIIIIKLYGDPDSSSEKMEKLLDRAASFRKLFDEMECFSFHCPVSVATFYRESKSLLNSDGFFEGKFFLQLIKQLFKFN